MSNHVANRRGFSLIELIVVVGIFSLLLGLILPAVQKVRATAERQRCAHHLRQIALACHLYHDSFDHFPPGREKTTRYERMAYSARLLPYLEQDELGRQTMERYRKNSNPFSDSHLGVRDRVLPVFGCPSDIRTTVPWLYRHIPDDKPLRIALLSYLGVNGASHREPNGVFHSRSATRAVTIRDGLSNTLMIGERPPTTDIRFGWWYAGEEQNGQGSLDTVLGVREVQGFIANSDYAACGPGPFHFQNGQINSVCSGYHFWSLHSGGSHFAMCDGSVQFFRYSSDEILPKLASKSGSEVVNFPD